MDLAAVRERVNRIAAFEMVKSEKDRAGLLDVLDAVMACHVPQPPQPSKPWQTCSCNGLPYPCATVTAFNTELEGIK